MIYLFQYLIDNAFLQMIYDLFVCDYNRMLDISRELEIENNIW